MALLSLCPPDSLRGLGTQQREVREGTLSWEAGDICGDTSPGMAVLMHDLQRRRDVTRTTEQWQWLLSAEGWGGRLVTSGTPLSPSPRRLSLSPCQAMSPWRLTVSPRTLLFLATWPFVTQWLLRRWQGRKR